MNDMILVEKLSKTYTSGKVTAVRDIDLAVTAGSVTAVMGKSGCGKTTLLNLIGGLDAPDSGRVTIDGTDISAMPENELSRFRADNIGFVFQFFNLIPELTAEENVIFPLMIRGVKPDAEYLKNISEVLELGELSSRLPSQLPGGQQQRVAIARAILHKPKLLLMDEPTGNLDEENSAKIGKLIGRLRGDLGITVFYVTHDGDMAKIADRVIGMSDGRIVSDEVNAR